MLADDVYAAWGTSHEGGWLVVFGFEESEEILPSLLLVWDRIFGVDVRELVGVWNGSHCEVMIVAVVKLSGTLCISLLPLRSMGSPFLACSERGR